MTTPADTGIQAAREDARQERDRQNLIAQADQKLFEALRCWPHQKEKKHRLIQESRNHMAQADAL